MSGEYWQEFHKKIAGILGSKWCDSRCTLDRAQQVMDENKRLQARVAELEGVVRHLPEDADERPVAPGMKR